MSGREVFVDVTYRGLELGRRLKVRDVGPSTAYLEHGTPMPVGAQVVITTDDGHLIPVEVLRVHEQVAGADMPPGMRVRADRLEGAAASWWGGLVSRDDPQIPEREAAPLAAGAAAPSAPPVDAAGKAVHPEAPATEPADRIDTTTPAADALPAHERPTQMMEAVDPALVAALEAGQEGGGREARRTVVMSAVEIREAIGTDPLASDDSPDKDSSGESGGRGARGKKRRRRR